MNMPILTTAALIERLQEEELFFSWSGKPTFTSGISADSRCVQPNNLFVCKGDAFNPRYLTYAQKAGVRAYICATDAAEKLAQAAPALTQIVVTDIRKALAVASAFAYGDPQEDLVLVGITGTKGKTTTATMLHALVSDATVDSVALIGTHEIFDGREQQSSSNTTPEPPELYRALFRARNNGCRLCIMEVSSQALKYERVYGLTFFISAFLNISPDHISPQEHPSYDDYLISKLHILETNWVHVVASSLIEQEPLVEIAAKRGKLVTFGFDATSTLKASGIMSHGLQTTFTVHGMGFEQLPITLNLPGKFNVENALCALAIARELDAPVSLLNLIAPSVFSHLSLPGRMDVHTSKNKQVSVVVDYAHNEASFLQFFSAMRETFPNHAIVAVFGACGNRALNRIEELPIAAAQFADTIVLTSDEPGPMPPEELVKEMAEYIEEFSDVYQIPNRQEAREKAFELAEATSKPTLLCFLGKGTEDTMQIGSKTVSIVPDTEAAKTLLARYDASHPL